MKIKITNYPYNDHPIGDVCDFGHELNTSLVGMGRAVWYTNAPSPIKQIVNNIEEHVQTVVESIQEVTQEPQEPKKKKTKFLNNQLRETIQEKQETQEPEPEQQTEEPKKKRASWRR